MASEPPEAVAAAAVPVLPAAAAVCGAADRPAQPARARRGIRTSGHVLRVIDRMGMAFLSRKNRDAKTSTASSFRRRGWERRHLAGI
jgi:hypothetical protein